MVSKDFSLKYVEEALAIQNSRLSFTARTFNGHPVGLAAKPDRWGDSVNPGGEEFGDVRAGEHARS